MVDIGICCAVPCRALLRAVRLPRQVLMPDTGLPVRVRIGLHSGRVMSGIVGHVRCRYCLFGEQ